MDVIVDGKAQFVTDTEAGNVFDLVVSIGKKLHEQGRSIMSVTLDGMAVSADALADSMKNKSIDAAGRLEVASADTRALVQESLSEIERSLAELPLACHELAKLFQSESPDSGYEPFQRFAAIWGAIKERELMVANAMEIPLDGFQIDNQSVKEFHTDLNGFLMEATRALEARDSVLIGDLLEYELAPRAEKETTIVALLKKEAERQTG